MTEATKWRKRAVADMAKTYTASQLADAIWAIMNFETTSPLKYLDNLRLKSLQKRVPQLQAQKESLTKQQEGSKYGSAKYFKTEMQRYAVIKRLSNAEFELNYLTKRLTETPENGCVIGDTHNQETINNG